jgi:hypothetical protein
LRLSSFFIFFWRSSSIFFLGLLSSWVKIRLHTENQFPGLSGSGLKVSLVVVGWGEWVGWGGGPSKYFVTPNLS